MSSPQSESDRHADEAYVSLVFQNVVLAAQGTLYLGNRFTVVKDLKKELGPGLLAAMCKQLGIRRRIFDVHHHLSR